MAGRIAGQTGWADGWTDWLDRLAGQADRTGWLDRLPSWMHFAMKFAKLTQVQRIVFGGRNRAGRSVCNEMPQTPRTKVPNIPMTDSD